MSDATKVFLTGSSGFIAKQIALRALQDGHAVRGSLRSLDRSREVLDAVRPHMADPSGLEDRLTFAKLDLLSDAGWAEALEGSDVLIHSASPFPISRPKHEDDLVRPAVDGTLRALKAAKAAGVTRVILTSSAAAIIEQDAPPADKVHDEGDWSDTNSAIISAYSKSKTLAERAAWDFARDEAPGMQLTVINPGMVFGPPLDRHFGSSLGLLQRLVRSKDPAIPRVCFGCVDVRDVAAMHVRAISNPATVGHRHLAVAGSLWMTDIAQIVAAQFPDRKIVTRRAPDWLVRLLALFDQDVKEAVPLLGRHLSFDNSRAREVFAMEFIPADEAIRAGAAYLVENRLV